MRVPTGPGVTQARRMRIVKNQSSSEIQENRIKSQEQYDPLYKSEQSEENYEQQLVTT
jgi:hypothetical protein